MDVLERFIERLKELKLVEPYECEHFGGWYIVDRRLFVVVKRVESDCVTFRHVSRWIEEIIPEITEISETRNLQLKTVLLTTAQVAEVMRSAFERYDITAFGVKPYGDRYFMGQALAGFGISE